GMENWRPSTGPPARYRRANASLTTATLAAPERLWASKSRPAASAVPRVSKEWGGTLLQWADSRVGWPSVVTASDQMPPLGGVLVDRLAETAGGRLRQRSRSACRKA